MTDLSWLDTVKWDSKGLVPAIAQDAKSGQVLMMAWMNRDSLEMTAKTQQVVYFSRSRGKLWRKGESSGHVQKLHSLRLDCDADVILLAVEQLGGIACHTGRAHCFYRELEGDQWVATDPVLKSPNEIYGAGHE